MKHSNSHNTDSFDPHYGGHSSVRTNSSGARVNSHPHRRNQNYSNTPGAPMPHVAAGGFVPPKTNYSPRDAGRHVPTGNVRGTRQKQGGRPPRRGVWTVVLVISLIVLLISGGVLGMMIFEYSKGTRQYDKIADEVFVSQDSNNLASMSINWDALRQKNEDVVAWVYMPGTSISYPVVQGDNDEEYLNKTFLKEDTLLVHKGSIFLSEVNKPDFSDSANYLFGHNMNDDTMFGPIMDMFDQKEFDAHRIVYILTPEMNYRCETFALTLIPSTDVDILQPNFSSNAAMLTYISDQIRDSKVSLPDGYDTSDISKLFAFITCGDDYANTRAVLFSGVKETAVPDKNGAVVLDSDGDGVVDSESGNK